MTGGNCNTMQIEAYNKDNKLVASLNDNNQLVGFYPLDDGMRLHVIDDFQLRNQFDSEDVPKFEISEEEYAKRGNTVKTFLMKNKMGMIRSILIFLFLNPFSWKFICFTYFFCLKGKYNQEYVKNKEQQEAEEKSLAESIKIGSRCKVTVTNAPTRLGTVMYTGSVDGLQGSWIGIKYDEPVGKHDGM